MVYHLFAITTALCCCVDSIYVRLQAHINTNYTLMMLYYVITMVCIYAALCKAL